MPRSESAGSAPLAAPGPSSSPRLVLLAASAVALAWIGWQIIANTAADTSARTDPASALEWRPDSAVALGTLAQQHLSLAATGEADLAGVTGLANHAVVTDPLDADAISLLGLAAAVRGDTDDADGLMRVAAARSLRETGAEMWLFERALQRADFAAAIASADTIMRTQPDVGNEVYPSLVELSSDAAGQAAMIGALARDPPWRGWFLEQLPQTPDGLAIADPLLAGLAKTAAPTRTAELDPYLEKLVDYGSFQLAFLTWLRFLPPEEAKSVPFVYNGDFEQPVSGLPFDWQFSQVRGADTEVVDTTDPEIGKALRVVFANTRVDYHQVTKVLVLPPGPYELSGMVKAEDLTTPRGMRWRVACADGDKHQLAESDAFLGTFAWKAFSAAFTVPATGCDAQTLRLELDTRVALDQQVVGTFWSDGLAISRVDFTSPSN